MNFEHQADARVAPSYSPALERPGADRKSAIPSSGEPEALVDYLRSLSIEYLIFVNPKGPMREGSGTGLSSRLVEWNRRPASQQPSPCAILWFLDAAVRLSARYEKIYDSDEVVVLSLKSKVSAVSQ
jgi:hypothetical protein